MDKSQVIKEQRGEEAKSQWWRRGATGTGSAFRICRKLQPQPLQCTSRASYYYMLSSPRHHHSQQVSLGHLSQTVPMYVCVLRHWPFYELKA